MKRIFIKLLLFVIAGMLLFFLQGKTEETNLTLEETGESFEQYEKVVQDFVAQPTEGKIAGVVQFAQKFSGNYYTLIEHQTLYNKVLQNEPLLKKQELEQLEELNRLKGVFYFKLKRGAQSCSYIKSMKKFI